MGLFKKLQENSLYWRYRFITRRYLAMRRWWRELRQRGARGGATRVQPRATASYNPYARSVRVNYARGAAFVILVAAAWTLITHSGLSTSGIPLILPQALVLVAIAYAFIRFW
jgi:hypothetical protein